MFNQGNTGKSTIETNAISVLNSRAASTLAAAGVFQGVSEDVSNYGRVGVSIKSDNATDGVLTMEVSHDNVTWGGPTRNFADTRFSEPHMWNIVEKYFRIKYTNGTTEATNLSIQVQYSSNADILLGHQLDATLLDETEAIITKSVAVGQDPLGAYTNVKQDGIGFSTSTLLTNGQTYDSGILSLIGYTQVHTNILSVGANGSAILEFYEDLAGSNLLRTITIPYIDGSGFKAFSSLAFTPYVRYQFTCSEVGQTQFYYDTKFSTTSLSGQILGVNDFISSGMVANLGRNVLVGQTDGGVYKNVPISPEGHIETEIHGPLNGWGSVHTESLDPFFQTDAVYGLNDIEVAYHTGLVVGSGANSASTTAANSLFTCATGTTIYSFADLQSRSRIRSKVGQGTTTRFAAFFSASVASAITVVGIGSGETGYFYAYNGTAFGVLHSTGGVRKIETLTVTSKSTAIENATITLNGIAHTIALTDATASTTALTAYEISKGSYPGWTASQIGSTVVFVSGATGIKGGAYSMTSGTAAGSMANTLTGVASTDTYIAQTAWNVDVCDGTGSTSNASGFLLDPSKGNVYEIRVNESSFGTINFVIEIPGTGGNNSSLVTVHSLNSQNTLTTVAASQPSMPFTMAATSAGSTTDVSVSVSGFASFLEGDKKNTGPRMSYDRSVTGYVQASSSIYYPLMTIKNNTLYKGRANQSVINLLSFGAAHDDATPVTYFLLSNATLLGTPSFAAYSADSCTSIDTAATTCSIADNNQKVFSLPIGQASGDSFIFPDEITLQPGETITIAARSVTGTATWTSFNLNTREDQ